MINNHDQWIKERLNGIGGSEASAIVGLNPYMSNIELWEYKTGLKVPEDISDKPYIRYGVEAERHLRELFALDHPEYEVEYKEFDLLRNETYPFIFATLDGRLVERDTGRKGILEIKTTEIVKSMNKEKWKDQIPDNYYIQVLHQMLATGFEYAILKAQLKYRYDDEVYLQTKHFRVERSDVKEDLEYLLNEECKFWAKVIQKKKPDLILPQI